MIIFFVKRLIFKNLVSRCFVFCFQEKEGIDFIGPSAEAITGMGDKLESKRLAMSAGVNTIPGERSPLSYVLQKIILFLIVYIFVFIEPITFRICLFWDGNEMRKNTYYIFSKILLLNLKISLLDYDCCLWGNC